MCRLYASIGGAVGAVDQLVDGMRGMRQASFRNADGAGLGWFDAVGEAHVVKAARPAHSVDLGERSEGARHARVLVGHVRDATVGVGELANTHPWTFSGRIAAHNGTVRGAEALEPLLGDYRALLRGSTDSERMIALMARHADEGGDVGAGMVAAMEDVRRLGLPHTSMNTVLGTPDELFALRQSANRTLWFRQGAGTAQDTGVLVASERLDAREGWKLLAPGELLHARVDGSVVRRRVMDPPEVVLPDPELDTIGALPAGRAA